MHNGNTFQGKGRNDQNMDQQADMAWREGRTTDNMHKGDWRRVKMTKLARHQIKPEKGSTNNHHSHRHYHQLRHHHQGGTPQSGDQLVDLGGAEIQLQVVAECQWQLEDS